MPRMRSCPLCGDRIDSLIDHLSSPDGEGCPHTPTSILPDDEESLEEWEPNGRP